MVLSLTKMFIRGAKAALVLPAICFVSSASGQTILDVTFGSSNDGLGGFTQSTTNNTGAGATSWTTNADSVSSTTSWISGTGSLINNSLLRSVTIDRSNGKSYQITGILTWSAEADRNNRQGIYLFGDEPDLGVDPPGDAETGNISFLYNSDDQQIVSGTGIGAVLFGSPITASNPVNISNPDVPATNSYYTDEQLTYQADIDFVNNGGTDQIEITLTMFNDFGGTPSSDSIDLIVDAADYTGSYFGFAGRTRNDTGPGNDSIANYESFSITDTTVPEPSTYALITGCAVIGLAVMRRRRQ